MRNFSQGRRGTVMVIMALGKFGKRYRLLLFSSALIIGIILVFVFWRFAGLDQQVFRMVIELDLFGGVFGLVFFVLIYATFTVFLIPTLPMNVFAGFVWGGWTGGLISCLAVTLGSWISFSLSRSGLRHWAGSITKPVWFERVEQDINQNDWRYLIFIRMNPIFPTGPINYLVGLTEIKNIPYLACTFLPLLLPTTLFAFAGSLLDAFNYRDVLELNFSHVLILMAILSGLFFILILLMRRLKGSSRDK